MCKIDPTSKVGAGSQLVNVEMKRYSFCGYDCKMIQCSIGAFCSVADEVIVGGVRHPMEWVATSSVFYHDKDCIKKKFSMFDRPPQKKTIIGNDVWIGDRALIKEGVVIGDGAVIGMGSVVTKNVPPYEIWAGNPARFIRKRFDEEIIKELLEMRWWDFDEDTIQRKAEFIRNPEEFIHNK